LVDQGNVIHMFCSRNLEKNMIPDVILHSYSSKGISWSKAFPVSSDKKGNNLYPQPQLDSKNNIHLIWQFSKLYPYYSSDIIYSRWDGIIWTTPKVVLYQVSKPSFIIDSENNFHIIYKNKSKNKFEYLFDKIN
jgi:hypothetical protein